MRLKKGDRVEVLCKKEVSSGSWSCAEITSGNGHTYSVRYSSFPIAREEAVERVPRKAIRPCPPPVEGPNAWVAGDLAEVYHNFTWKQAKITKIVGNGRYIARLLGSPLDVLVCHSHLRMRQAWQNGNWFVLGKGPEVPGSFARKRQLSARTEPEVVKTKDQQPEVLSTVPLKRRLAVEFLYLEAHKTSAQKRKVAEKDARYLPLSPNTKRYFSQEINKVKLKLPISTGNTKVFTDDVRVRECNPLPGSSNHMHMDNCASSVGSTSSKDDFCEVSFISLDEVSKYGNDTDYCSDAESSTGREHEERHSCSNKEVLARSHRSELSAYCSLIRRMYASGPLSWEDERRLTNIRAALHISNDEYLIELRNLISANKETFV